MVNKETRWWLNKGRVTGGWCVTWMIRHQYDHDHPPCVIWPIKLKITLNNDILHSCLTFQVMPLARNQRNPRADSQSYCLHSYIMGHASSCSDIFPPLGTGQNPCALFCSVGALCMAHESSKRITQLYNVIRLLALTPFPFLTCLHLPNH